MSDGNAFAFGKFIPGFDFLQQLSSAPKAGSALPGLGQWVAPTVSVEELDKRIKELKAVQFWLEQNVTAIKATVQALEVQKMTLATLQGMNVSMTEVAKAFAVAVPPAATPAPASGGRAAAAREPDARTSQSWPFDQSAATTAPAPQPVPVVAPVAAPKVPPEPAAPTEPATASKGSTRTSKTKARSDASATDPAATAAAAAARMADGMQWWNALTQQFQQIAANALREAVPAKVAHPEEASDKPAAEKGAAKKAAAKKAAAKRGAAKKSAAARAKSTARKSTASAEAKPRESAPARNSMGWPLPPPVKRR